MLLLLLAAVAAYHLALHCLADLRTMSEEIRAHWLRPYFMTAALRISSCRERQTTMSMLLRVLLQQALHMHDEPHLGVLPNTTLYHNPHGC